VTDPAPIACTLGAGDLRQRLDEIAALGAESLLCHESKDGVHTLRFRPDEGTRHRLEQVAAAEARCCSFLDLAIDERDGELVLTIATSEGGEPTAKALALAFSSASDIDHT
jgi:hypothetical protein